MSALLKKPRKWNVNPGLVAPEWRWFFRGLVVVYPMWEGVGDTFFSTNNDHSATFSAGTPVWSHSSGLEIDFSGASAAAQSTDSSLTQFASATQVGWTIYCRATSYILTGGSTAMRGPTGATGHILYPFDTLSGNGFRVHAAGTNVVNENGAALADGKNHLFTYSQFTSTDHRGFVDGVQVDSSSTSASFLSDADRLNIGAWRGDGNQSFHGQISYVALHNRPLTLREHAQLARDPFGPFRMDDEVGPVIGLSVAFTSANLALNHSGASDIGGAIGVELTDDTLNNLWDDVSSGDASAGDTEFRCTYVKNTHGSLSVVNVKAEIDTDPTESNWETGLGAAGLNGTETEIADEDTTPAGVSFGTTALDLGTLAAGDFFPIWIKRIVAAGAGAATPDSGVLSICGDDPN